VLVSESQWQKRGNMSKLIMLTICLLISNFGFAEENNDFYDNTETYLLQNNSSIQVEGEVKNSQIIDFDSLTFRSVIVKEMSNSNDQNEFVGSYRYDGFSLFDILKDVEIKKKNEAEFSRVIDLLVIVENDSGEKVIFSWGEIFYPSNLHKIIIATRVSLILPSTVEVNYPIPQQRKLVCEPDLISIRSINNPTKITIMSSPYKHKNETKSKNLYSSNISFYDNNIEIGRLDKTPDSLENYKYSTIFYGRGKGLHNTTDFSGVLFKKVITKYLKNDFLNLKTVFLTISAVDGYRITISLSELINRNDFAEFLFIERPEGEKGGKFSLFPAPDFFSDRAIKAISEIHLNQIEN